MHTQSERLETHGIDKALAERFHLGYAPADYTIPSDSSLTLVDAGLLTADGKPKISDRLVMPVTAGSGTIIGFVATELPDRTPRPPVVCGLSAASDHLIHVPNQPRVRSGDIFVVLSPLEILPLTALGVPCVAVPLAYPLSAHFTRLSRLADNVTLCLPEGATGEMIAVLAAHQLANVLDGDSPAVRTLFFQADRSLSQVVRQVGVNTFKEHARTAEPLLDAAIRILSRKLNAQCREDRQRYLGHLKRFSNSKNRAVGLIAADAMARAWGLPLEPSGVVKAPIAEFGPGAASGELSLRWPAIRILSILLRSPSCKRYIPEVPGSRDPAIGLLRELPRLFACRAEPGHLDVY